jgi:hypothetical protein
MSAVALVTLGEGRDQVYIPRLNTKALLNQRTAEMFTKQILQMGLSSVELGTPGHKKNFNVAKLEGEYETTYKYYTKSPKIDIARLAMGDQALRMGLDRLTVYKDILQYEDPEGALERYYAQQAEILSPTVMRDRVITSLLKIAEENKDAQAAREAMAMIAEMGAIADQMAMGGGVSPGQPQQAGGEPIMPLLGENGKVGGVKPLPTTIAKE